jgi:hypothetical protein
LNTPAAAMDSLQLGYFECFFIKIIYYFILKKLFLILVRENDIKTYKKLI